MRIVSGCKITKKNAHTQEHVHFFMIGRRFAYWTGKALMDALQAIGYRFQYPLPISEASITHYPLPITQSLLGSVSRGSSRR